MQEEQNVTVRESLHGYYLAFVRGAQVVKLTLKEKLKQLANAINPKQKEEADMPMGAGTYGSMRGRPKKSQSMKKQAATAMAMKKAKKKPKKKM
jgi:hypothetical protein